jgi:phosphoglucosamine mutase
MGRLFGTDGVRGIAGTELTEELAFGLGRAAVLVLGRRGEGRPTFVVGRDTRESGEWLEDAVIEGIRAGGGDSILAGIQPTPAVAYLTTALNASAGVVISASHNPAEYNGIKFFSRTGTKLSEDLEDEIEASLDSPVAEEPGHVRSLGGEAERYLEHLVSAAESRLDGMTVVVDCANGSSSGVSPQVLRLLGATVHAIFEDPDGRNINAGCGALHPDVVAAEVLRLGADAGVAHDGDADRALFADARGNVIDGDQVLAACAISMHEQGRLDGDTVVATVMSNLGFHRAMADAGIRVIAADVGDRFVVKEMVRTGAALGGEQSGHVIFREQAMTGDGLLTAVRFLSLAVRKGVSVEEVASAMRRYPQVMRNVEVRDGGSLAAAGPVWDAVRAAEAELGEAGRVLVRASGTEPLVRVMVEADNDEIAAHHANAIATIVENVLGPG